MVSLIVLKNVFANDDKEYLVNFLRLVIQLLKRLPTFYYQATRSVVFFAHSSQPRAELSQPVNPLCHQLSISYLGNTVVFQQLPAGGLRTLSTSSNVYTCLSPKGRDQNLHRKKKQK